MLRRARAIVKRFAPGWFVNLYRRLLRRPPPEGGHLYVAIQELLDRAVGRETEIVVLDIGANVGQSILRFNRYLEQAVFHTFEPIPRCHAILLDQFQGPNFFHNHVALSNVNETREFYEFRKADTSSFLLPDKTSKWASQRAETWAEGDVENLVAARYEVSTMTLDNYLDNFEQFAKSRIHLLKVDTQGHESEVFGGATKLLSDPQRRPLLIESELILGAMYEKHVNFFDIEQSLVPLGYRLIGVSRGGNLIQEPWFSVDVLYASPELESKIPR